MSNKLVKLTPEQKKQQDDERYMQGRPTRMEVANYVNALLEEKYMPQLQGQISLGFMVIQAILIEKGICTGEQRQKEAQKAQKAKPEPKQDK